MTWGVARQMGESSILLLHHTAYVVTSSPQCMASLFLLALRLGLPFGGYELTRNGFSLFLDSAAERDNRFEPSPFFTIWVIQRENSQASLSPTRSIAMHEVSKGIEVSCHITLGSKYILGAAMNRWDLGLYSLWL